MIQATRTVRPASVVYFPLAVFAAFLGLIFALQLACLLIVLDQGSRMMANPFEDEGPVLAELHQVRVANYPRSRAPIPGVRAESAGADDLDRAVFVVLEELGKYGDSALRRTPLRRVVLASNLTLEGRGVGGVTFGNRGLILLDVGASGLGTKGLIRHGIHHEMSHILDEALRLDGTRDDRWSRLNPADFRYGGDEIVRALEVLGEHPGRRPDAPGFLTYYAVVSPREDRAEVFAAMMTHREELGLVAGEDPILRAKCRLLRSELVGWAPGFASILKSP